MKATVLFLLLGLVTCKSNDPQEAKAKYKNISGVLQQLHSNNDGYEAILETSEGPYILQVSPANLKDPKSYKSFLIGESMGAEGECTEIKGERHMTVRVLH